MVKAIVLYEQEPDPERYARHVEQFGTSVPGATFKHGKVFGAPMGDDRYRYFAEFEWQDMEAFKEGSRSEQFAASGKDAAELGVPFHVYLVETD